MKQYLAIDIGGTAVKLGIVDETGAVGSKAEESVNFDGYQTPVLTTVLKAAKAFVETQNIDVNTLEGVGVSATGQIDSRKGIVAGTCGNFPNYINSPIQAELERLFGLPVTVANDANCMTLGEVWVGGAKGYTDVIGVTLGTGVGSGIILDGKIVNGGFMVLEPGVFDYIEGDDTVFEKAPLEQLAKDGQLMVYRHDGFWKCMDTQRDKMQLEQMWQEGNAPWKLWK